MAHAEVTDDELRARIALASRLKAAGRTVRFEGEGGDDDGRRYDHRRCRYRPGDRAGGFVLVRPLRRLWEGRCLSCGKLSLFAPSDAPARCRACHLAWQAEVAARRGYSCSTCGETRPRKFKRGTKVVCMACSRAKCRNGACACGRALRVGQRCRCGRRPSTT